MNIDQVTQEIKKIDLFKDLELIPPTETSQFGTIKIAPKHFKDKNKNEVILSGTYYLFIAHMYKNSTKMTEFFYLTFYNSGSQRDYRRRTFYPIEYNKLFVSGSSVESIIEELKEKLINYELK